MAKKINIIAITDTQGAAFYRLSLWEKGLIENGIDVKIYFLIKSKLRLKALKYLFFLVNLFKVVFICRGSVWIYGHPFKWLPFFLKQQELIIERTEYPAHLISPKILKKQHLNNYKYASYFITCSNALTNFYKNYLNKQCAFYKASILVDSSIFAYCDKKSPIREKYIAYCGSMGNNKDGVHDLLKAYSIFLKRYHEDVKLCLIGNAEKEIMNSLEHLTEELCIEKNVIFTGLLDHDKMPEYLYNSELLVLARPGNKQAEGGFPSKLGEYLSTGKPVLVTSVGEISDYIKDGENGYIVEPERPDLFAEKMMYIFDNYNEAQNVGLAGQQMAKKEFDYKIVTKKLIDFLERQS